MTNTIYILTGPTQTGKTTGLIEWSSTQSNVYGILTPVIEGKRYFFNAHTHEQFPMEATGGETDTLVIGRFVFGESGFNKAIQQIRNSISKEGWLIIDEIGPLELQGKGFSGILKEVLAKRQRKVLIVVREGLVEKVKEYFNLREALITNEVPGIHL